MVKPFLSHPVKQIVNPTNMFGANPALYKPLGQAGHPGWDYEAPTGTKVFAPASGEAFYATDSLGGDGEWIRTTNENQNYNIILWHMPSPAYPPAAGVSSAKDYPFQIPTDRSMVKIEKGQFLGYSDNSGYHPVGESESTAPHLHFAVMPADALWHALYPNNGFLGCVDPTPYMDGTYAEDIQIEQQILEKTAEVTNVIATAPITDTEKSQDLGMVEIIINKIKNFFK